MFEKSRVNKNGGGIILYIKENLGPVEITKPLIQNVDVLFVQLKNNQGNNVTISLVYRPPAQPVHIDGEIYKQISELCDINDAVIFGDFNLSISRWGEPNNLHNGHDLYTNLQESSLTQFVQSPTRNNNILDLVLATKDDLIDNLIVGDVFSNSDHRIITFTINFISDERAISAEKIPDFRKANFEQFRALMDQIEWNVCRNMSDINDKWTFFTNAYQKATDKCIPMKNRHTTNKIKPKWWSKQIADCLKEKKNAHNRFTVTNNADERTKFINLRRKAKQLIRQSKKSMESHIASQSKTNPKEFYSYIRQKRVLTSSIGPLINVNDQITGDDEKMSTILNHFFASVFTSEDLSDIPVPSAVHVDNDLTSIKVTEGQVLNCIENLKVNKTPGPDKISPRVLKEAKNSFVKPLTDLFNISLQTGTLPDQWKQANVTPIFKKGSKSQPSNYRPISLTSIVCKMLESLIRDKLVNHLEENGILRDTQHGFRNRRSCLTNLLDFLHDILNKYDENKAVDVIYLDFQKAFDKVPHKRLIIKLKAHGIRGDVLRWIENWLKNRKQRVVINGKASHWNNVTSGVPQGSVLGPVLFLIYINDIDLDLTCIISKFADDTKIANTVTNVNQAVEMQNNLDKLANWAKTWQMRFNTDKCKVLHIGSRNEKANYVMDGNQLKTIEKEVDLGVTISNNLKPSMQCSDVVKKANKMIGFIGRSFEYKTKDTILTLYNALVRPLLEYCVQAWCPYYQKDIDKLERVQRRVTKIIPSLRNKPYEERLKELNLFSLSQRRMRGDLIQVFKIIKGIDNMDCNKYFTINHSNYTRGNGCKIIGKQFKSHESKNFFFNRVVNLWNGLPREVIECNSVDAFKRRLDKYFENNPRLNTFVNE
jgi:hypothetical protein